MTHSPESFATDQHVLLVEDNAVAREKVGSILRELGCRATTAVDGMEGLKKAGDLVGDLDMIVLDIQMPRMDGITMLRYVRKAPALSHLRVVMLTTQADQDTVRKALGYKANDFIRKDATIAHITERLVANLAKTKAVKEDAPQPRSMAALADGIIKGSKKHDPEQTGPYILFFEAAADLRAMGEGKNEGMVRRFQAVLTSLDELNRAHPKLGLGYSIEHETAAVARLLKSGAEPIHMVMVSARREEGFSLARRLAFAHKRDPQVYLICESNAAVPLDERDSLRKTGVELVSDRELAEGSLSDLVSKHYILRPD